MKDEPGGERSNDDRFEERYLDVADGRLTISDDKRRRRQNSQEHGVLRIEIAVEPDLTNVNRFAHPEDLVDE